MIEIVYACMFLLALGYANDMDAENKSNAIRIKLETKPNHLRRIV